LPGSFRPEAADGVWRTCLRQRDELVGTRSAHCQHMQKALLQMNIPLPQVRSDVAGVSGLAISDALLKGERDPARLAALVDRRVRATAATLQQALPGDYRAEPLLVRRQACELYNTDDAHLNAWDEQIVRATASLPAKVDPALKPLPARKPGRSACQDKMAGVDRRPELPEKFGVELTGMEGIGVLTALILLTEVGPNVSRFHSEKPFCSWLGLCPDNRISGGKVLSRRTRRVVNRASDALRMAASSLDRSQTALGGFARRMKARLGAAEGITATAHKLARIVYRLLKHGEACVRQGLAACEKKFAERKLHALQKTATAMGFELVQKQTLPSAVS